MSIELVRRSHTLTHGNGTGGGESELSNVGISTDVETGLEAGRPWLPAGQGTSAASRAWHGLGSNTSSRSSSKYRQWAGKDSAQDITVIKASQESLNVPVVAKADSKEAITYSPAAAQQPILHRHAHSFFSAEMTGCRREYFKIVLRATFLTILLSWSCLPIYWGSLSSSSKLTGNLSVWVVDRDQARIGIGLTNAVQAAQTSGIGSLGWQVVTEADAGDDNAVIQSVLNENIWMAIVVSENATLRLSNARARGNASYDPTSAVTVYYAQARNEVASANFLVPLATKFLSNFTATFASDSVQRFIDGISSTDGSVNTTALQLIALAPQTLSPAIGYKMVNLRPYTSPTAQAITLVGQIYIVIFAFIFVMAHSTARTFIEPFLTYGSYMRVRIFVPLAAYFPLSFSYAMVSLPFKLPFGAKYSYAAGFFAFFAFIYMGMCALGLALESIITLLTPRFVPFFLVLLIIVNISTAALPPELQNPFYLYGAGFQFAHIEDAIRTIIFNTASHLGEDAGVLIFWTILSAGTMSLFTLWVRRRDLLQQQEQRSRRSPGASRQGSVRRSGPGSVRNGSGSIRNGLGNARNGSGSVGSGKEEDVRVEDKGKWDVEAGPEVRSQDGDTDGERGRGRDVGGEGGGEETVEEDETWKRASVDLGLAHVESRSTGSSVIAFQA